MRVRKEKKSGPKPWMLDMGLVLGKRKREFFKTKPEAEQALKDKEALRRLEGENALAVSDADKIHNQMAKERADKIGMTLLQCVVFCEQNARGYSDKLLADAVAECMAAKTRAGNRPDSIVTLKRRLDVFSEDHPKAKASQITREQVEAWISKGSVKLVTTRGRLTDIKTLFSFCLKRKWVLSNPCAGIDKIQVDNKPPGIHTVPEVERLLAAAVEHDAGLIGYICLTLFGGLRPNESAQITPKEVHEKFIEVTPEVCKTRRRRFVPINKTLRAWLDVPMIKFGGEIVNEELLRRMKALKAKLAPFPWYHDVLRHSFCSYSLPVNGATKTAEMAGHSEAILFAHYRERVRPEDARKFWALRP